jgi:hypothetical protein
MHYHKTILSTVIVAAMACASPDTKVPEATPPAGPNVVTFTAMDFSFDGPTEIPAGPTTLNLVSSGKEIHHMVLFQLAEGKTMDSLAAAMKNPGPPPAWATMIGGPNAPTPGGTSNASLNLQPGNYAMVCFVDTPDKVPHMAKGMTRALTVTPVATTPNAVLATPTHNVTLTEYAFTVDKPFTAGKQTVKVTNHGAEAHELEIIKMEPGKTLADFGKWMESMAGPPPGAPIGGASPLVPHRDLQFDVDLTPGHYVMVCFVAAPDKKMHLEKGMVMEFDIQ